ncbi:replication-relaxation family protein [Streptomyces sp. NRRL B-24484]|uniref:replication-relaxation family protein n=1 Tax=Streptomyces sp. NRRL B-24484 TaxID=1463833 RepID=UPI001331B2D4|nr:replication-relaxation family protein [Streptomyces sp. NRRL B-24484]
MYDRKFLCSLFMHRMATAAQLHELVSPDAHITRTRRRLNELRRQGVVDQAVVDRRKAVWYLTERGRTIGSRLDELDHRTSPPAPEDPFEARMRSEHTLAVLDAHLAFLQDARRRGDEYGYLDWEPEIYHRVVEQGADALIADALMRYTVVDPERELHRAFIEVDRATMSSESLARKLLAYARFHQLVPTPVRQRGFQAQSSVPVWKSHYPAYPRILFVLAEGGPAAQARRIRDLQALAQSSPLVELMFQTVRAGVASLKEMQEAGPSAPVWASLVDPQRARCGWMEL